MTNRPDITIRPLVQRVRAGLGWNLSASLVGQLTGFLRAIFMARLLAPDDFGLFGMALTVIAGINALTAISLDQSIIANQFATREELKAQLDTVWSAELMRSVIVAVLLLGCAYPASRFYELKELRLVIAVLSLSVVFQGLQNVGLALLRKEVSFSRLFWYETAVNLMGLAFTVAVAFAQRNVWALILGQLFTTALGAWLSYVFHSYRPHFTVAKIALQRALHFGKFAAIIAATSYAMTMADNVVVGRQLGSTALGYYALAYNVAMVPIGLLIYSLGRVLFPAYAELAAKNPARLDQVFTKIFSLSAMGLVVVTVPTFLLADEAVTLLFGNKWRAAGPALRVLILVVPFRGLLLVISTLFFGVNRPRQVAVGKIFESILFLALLYPFVSKLGITGAAWAGVVAYTFAFLNRLIAVGNIIPGMPPKLMRISFATIAATSAGLLVGRIGLVFLDGLMPRIILGGSLSMIVSALVLLSIRTDLRKWVFEVAH